MPTMPRMSGKAKRIAYSILGVPANLASKKDAVSRKINKRLVFEETTRVR